MKFMLTNNKIIVFLPQNEQFITFPETHKNYAEVYDFLMTSPDDEKGFLELFISIATEAIEKYSNGEVKVANGVATIDGLPLPVDVLDKLRELKADGYDWTEQRKFWGHCLLNPRKESVADLFRFISNHKLTITEEGHFLAYKAITSDFKDKYSRTFDNRIGKTVTMNREDVVMNPDIYCAAGLHVSNLHYASNFADYSAGDIVVLVDVNPEDVVSVPKDCNAEKIRTCAYKVLKVWSGDELPTSVVSIDENNNVKTKKEKKVEDIKKKRNSTESEWTTVEIEILKRITKDADIKGSSFDWNGVSKILGNRSVEACKREYQKIKGEKSQTVAGSNVTWTEEEMSLLKKLTKDYHKNRKGAFDWDKVASNFVNRTAKACFYKHYDMCKTGAISTDKSVSKINRIWSNKDENKLIRYYYKGATYKKMCDIFNKSSNSIASKIYHLKQEGKIK